MILWLERKKTDPSINLKRGLYSWSDFVIICN